MPLDKDSSDEILRSIGLEGAASEENKSVNIVLGNRANLGHVINLASGLPQIRPNLRNKFDLILSQPEALQALSPLQVRCCLCNRVISYPAWHYHVKYAVNHFHYFICFTGNNGVTAKCYRRIE